MASLHEFLAQLRRFRLVYAERLFVEIITGPSEGAGAASQADIAKFAAAALPFQVAGVAQLVEHGGICPNVSERLPTQIASDDRQVAAGVNLALVRNETNTGPGETSLGHGVHVMGMPAGMTGVPSKPGFGLLGWLTSGPPGRRAVRL